MGKIADGAAFLRDYARLAVGLPGAAKPVAAVQPKNILCLGYAAVGDLIFMLPALKTLRTAHPQARLVFVGDHDPGATELLPAAHLADEIWTYTHPALATERVRDEIVTRVWDQNFDAVIVNQATPLRPFARAILPIPLRVGHLRPLEHGQTGGRGWSAPRKILWKLKRGMISSEIERRWVINRPVWVAEEAEHAVIRNLRLSAALGGAMYQPEESRPELPLTESAKRWAVAHIPEVRGRTIGIHLGSPTSQYHKIWSPKNWGGVANELARDFKVRIVLIGGPAEAREVAAFRSVFDGDFIDLVGKGGLLESFAAIGRCDLFLSSDTGLSKAAQAMAVPTLSVWGPISRKDTGAIWNPDLHAEVSLDLPCSPCVSMALRKEGPGVLNYDNCGHHNCLNQITSNMVYGQIVRHHGRRLRD